MVDPLDTLAAARVLVAEDATSRLVEGLRRRGVHVLVLKGVSTERWLYQPQAETRLSGDVDVLVAPGAFSAAETALRELGFVNRYDGAAPSWAEEHADSWRSDAWPLPVDLHRRLWGFEADAASVWQALWASREPLRLAGGEVLVPGEPERLLVTALHAAHHVTAGKALEDLRRALRQVDPRVWERAAVLAGDLGAVRGLVAGLELDPEGRALRERLGLRDIEGLMPEAHSRMWDAPATAEGFLRVMEAAGVRAKVRLLWREVVPSAEFMRLRSAEAPLARRGPRGLAAAYLVRWTRLLHAAAAGGPAALRLHRARR